MSLSVSCCLCCFDVGFSSCVDLSEVGIGVGSGLVVFAFGMWDSVESVGSFL